MSDERCELDIDDALARMGELVERLQALEEGALKEQIFELLDWIDAFHREGLVRLANLVDPAVLDAARADPVVARLLETYLDGDLDEAELQEALEEALDEVRPYIHSHGGEMEVVSVSDGVVKLRLMGACDGCPASSQTLTQGVEKILRERWPAFRGLEVEGAEQPPARPQQLLQIQTLRRG